MDIKEKQFEISRFAGLHDSVRSNVIADNECSILKNLDVNLVGELSPRPGFISLGNDIPNLSLGCAVIGVLVLEAVTSILVADGTTAHKFQSSEDNGTTWTVRYDYLAGAASETYPAVQYVNKMYFTHIGKLYSWDGTTIVQIAGAVGLGLTQIFVHKDRLFGISGNSGTRSRIYYSAVGDFTSWPASNFINIEPDDGDMLMCGVSYNDIVFLFKTRKTYQLTVQGDPSEWSNRFAFDVGTIGRQLATVCNGVVYFVSRVGIYQTNGGELVRISDNISLNAQFLTVSPGSLDGSNGKGVSVYGQKVIFQLGNNNIYVYDTRTNAWTMWSPNAALPFILPFREFKKSTSNLDAVLITLIDFNAAYKKLLYIPPSITATTDYGLQYTVQMRTKAVDHGDASIKRGTWAYSEIQGFNDTVIAKWIYESTVSANVPVNATGLTLQAQRFKGPRVFREIALDLSMAVPSIALKITKVGWFYRAIGRRISKDVTAV